MKSLVWVMAASLLLGTCRYKNSKTEQAPTSSADSSSSYLTDSVRQMNPESELTLNGTVTFDQDNVVRVFPLVNGNVEKTTASLGVYVQKGRTWHSFAPAIFRPVRMITRPTSRT